ncbi:MAG: sigma 54-interacting transcriptional regulator [Candidatus Binatia bacterium]
MPIEGDRNRQGARRRGIHDARPGARRAPFVAINCGAPTRRFSVPSCSPGHRRGAFTARSVGLPGQWRRRRAARSCPRRGRRALSMQVGLLRVLQESEILPVGETRVRGRSTCASSLLTNRDLQAEVKRGAFRWIYHWLAGFLILLPALREHRGRRGTRGVHSRGSARASTWPDRDRPGGLDLLVRLDLAR